MSLKRQWAKLCFLITKEWEWEIGKRFSARDKSFKQIKSSRLSIDWEIYKDVGNKVLRLIKNKKNILRKKLTENIVKPRDLSKTLKSSELPN